MRRRNESIDFDLPPETLSGMAALMEGDGHFAITKKNKNKKGQGPYYNVTNQVYTGTPTQPETMRAESGVGRMGHTARDGHTYRWSVSGEHAVSLSDAMYPYLREKRAQVDKQHELQDIKRQIAAHGGHATEEETEQMEAIHQDLLRLHKYHDEAEHAAYIARRGEGGWIRATNGRELHGSTAQSARGHHGNGPRTGPSGKRK